MSETGLPTLWKTKLTINIISTFLMFRDTSGSLKAEKRTLTRLDHRKADIDTAFKMQVTVVLNAV